MRNVIAAINMTIDGFCDHTAIDPSPDIHQHYANLLKEAGVVLYGRITYQLMEYWRTIVANPTGISETDEFATIMDDTPKIVFSTSLREIDWHSAKLSDLELEVAVRQLKTEPGKDIFIGSRSLMLQLLKVDLIDELQLCIHPIVTGQGMSLFENMERKTFNLTQIKTFNSGAVIHYYVPNRLSFASRLSV